MRYRVRVMCRRLFLFLKRQNVQDISLLYDSLERINFSYRFLDGAKRTDYRLRVGRLYSCCRTTSGRSYMTRRHDDARQAWRKIPRDCGPKPAPEQYSNSPQDWPPKKVLMG